MSKSDVMSQEEIDNLLSGTIDMLEEDVMPKSSGTILNTNRNRMTIPYNMDQYKIEPTLKPEVVYINKRKDENVEYICYSCKNTMVKNKLLGPHNKVVYTVWCPHCKYTGRV